MHMKVVDKLTCLVIAHSLHNYSKKKHSKIFTMASKNKCTYKPGKGNVFNKRDGKQIKKTNYEKKSIEGTKISY